MEEKEVERGWEGKETQYEQWAGFRGQNNCKKSLSLSFYTM
jgi:hypothetical protein